MNPKNASSELEGHVAIAAVTETIQVNDSAISVRPTFMPLTVPTSKATTRAAKKRKAEAQPSTIKAKRQITTLSQKPSSKTAHSPDQETLMNEVRPKPPSAPKITIRLRGFTALNANDVEEDAPKAPPYLTNEEIQAAITIFGIPAGVFTQPQQTYIFCRDLEDVTSCKLNNLMLRWATVPQQSLDSKKKNVKPLGWNNHYISIYTITYATRGKDKGKAKEVLWKKGPFAGSETMAWQLLWRDLMRPILVKEGKRKEKPEVLVEDAVGNQAEAKLGLPGEEGEYGDELEGMEVVESVANENAEAVDDGDDGESDEPHKAPASSKPKKSSKKKKRRGNGKLCA